MKLRFVGLAAFWLMSLTAAYSQESGALPKPVTSSGLTLAIKRSSAEQRTIVLQFTLTNNTSARIYVRDALFEESQKAFLGSGPQLNWPSAVAIELCQAGVVQCGRPPDALDLSKYSYVEPEQSMAFSFKYDAPTPVRDTDTISFTVSLMARYTKAIGNPSDAGQPQPIRFNFVYMPLNLR